MSEKIIRVENISKRYRIGLPPAQVEGKKALLRKLTNTFGYLASTLREATEEEILWALRDISFDVNRGEVVGLVGRNGAGKSTLLKVLSRITEPTEGRAYIKGRVGSLLEVGTGFHPELTGRENVYLNGSVLGMRRAEIDEKFEEIAEFSGVAKFLDTQVKRYSSGMRVRLAFSVAAHLQPEVLLIDEVLAVGDAAFQKKCLGKMGDISAQGRTILFVSHNMVAVQNLCNRAIWLQNGEIYEQGDSHDVVMNYLAKENPGSREEYWEDMAHAPGNELVRLRRLNVWPEGGGPSDPITMETPFVIDVEFWNLTPDLFLDVRVHLITEYDVIALGADTSTEETWHGRQFPVGIFQVQCHIPGNWLNAGNYRVAIEIVKDGRRKVYVQDSHFLSFDVSELGERSGTWFGKQKGIFRPQLEWKTELLGTNVEATPDLQLLPESQ